MSDPRKRDARRPLELLGLSAGAAIVIGLVVFASTRSLETGALWSGVAFVVILVVVAMLTLATNPDADRDDDETPPPGH